MVFFPTFAAAVIVMTMVAAPALAQQNRGDAPVAQMPGTTTQKSGEMSDAMVRKVGKALRQVVTIRGEYDKHTQSANTQQELQDLNKRAEQDMVKAISDQGLSVQQYRQAIQMAQADPKLKQRIVSAAEESDK
jgi:hypothetical protein